MKWIYGLSSLALLVLAGCGGKTAEVIVSGDNPEAMRKAPAGIATLVFMDLETIRPDALPAAIALPPLGQATGLAPAAALPGCVTSSPAGNVVTYTFTNCKAANTGVLAGTVTVTATVNGASTRYAEVFNLTASVDGNRQWRYTGTQTVTVTGASATLSVPAQNPILAAYSDAVTPAENKTYAFTAGLTMNWATANRLVVNGSYAFARTGVETITVAIATGDPLVWAAGCDYPLTGTLALALTGTTAATATATFGPLCGQMTLGGAAFTLGGH